MVSEMLVDWLKHAFITKFNHIRPSVYERYTDVLCRDLASGSAVGRHGARKVRITPCLFCTLMNVSRFQHSYVDQSPLVARRLGFASLPLAGLAILVGSQSVSLLFAVHSDGSGFRAVTALTNKELVHYAKWVAMGYGFWLWYAFDCIPA
jgi:hypothetical protein